MKFMMYFVSLLVGGALLKVSISVSTLFPRRGIILLQHSHNETAASHLEPSMKPLEREGERGGGGEIEGEERERDRHTITINAQF